MNERIWIEPLERSALLLAVMRAVAQPYVVIIEGKTGDAPGFCRQLFGNVYSTRRKTMQPRFP